MRFAAYAGASTALAGAVVLRAFHQRPNFYSASVYLAQSQACRMILLNLVLLCAYTFGRSLQKLLYGPLRPIEREQLWDKSWYAITETALAMTTFRDEVGAFFLVMFVGLLAGKVWGWISEGRVEILEQQPPTNPRLFHVRLVSSLLLSEIFDIAMLHYCVQTLLEQPRPGMMVMFAFEFAVLLITSTSTLARYGLSLQEALIVKRQTKARLEERREEARAAREEAQQPATDENAAPTARPELVQEDEDDDEDDIDVPGWQEKGRWVLFLDLLTDFLKLLVYMLFFTMLLLFHGIPIHIIRDVYLTMRSFLKRISDFQKYRNATRDMNARYPDATTEELERDGTCIICREDMRPWQQPDPLPQQNGPARRHARIPPDERKRPKKLPCGHILHLGCLKSWLERQQVCPTCRTSVLARNSTHSGSAENQPPAQRNAQIGQAQADVPAQQPAAGGEQGQGQQPPQGGRFNFAPFRAMAVGNFNNVRDALQRLRDPGYAAMADRIADMERQITRQIEALTLTQAQLTGLRQLQAELARLRAERDLGGQLPAEGQQMVQQPVPGRTQEPQAPYSLQAQRAAAPPPGHPHSRTVPTVYHQATLRSNPQLVPNNPLPDGLVLPEGWRAIPLQRMRVDRLGQATPQPGHQYAAGIVAQASFTATSQTASSEQNSGSQIQGGFGQTSTEPGSQVVSNSSAERPDIVANGTSVPDVPENETMASGANQPPQTTSRIAIPDWSQPDGDTSTSPPSSQQPPQIDTQVTNGDTVNGVAEEGEDSPEHSDPTLDGEAESAQSKWQRATVEDAEGSGT